MTKEEQAERLQALRDSFAAGAVAGVVTRRGNLENVSDLKMIARLAYDIADAMLVERQRRPLPPRLPPSEVP